MSGHDRLGSLQMSETRQHDIGIDLASIDKRLLKLKQLIVKLRQRVSDVKLKIGRYLIVSTSACMQSFATNVTRSRCRSAADSICMWMSF